MKGENQMKKLFVLVLLVSLFIGTSGLVFAGARGLNMSGDLQGQGKLQSDPHRIFRLVRFFQGSGTGAQGNRFIDCEISADSVVCWNLTEDDGVTVMLNQGRSLAYAAGVLATTCDSEVTAGVGNSAAQDIGKDNWAYLQTYGKCNFINDGVAAIEEGAALGTGRAFGSVCSFIASTTGGVNPVTGSANGQIGFAYDSIPASAAKFEGFIRTN